MRLLLTIFKTILYKGNLLVYVWLLPFAFIKENFFLIIITTTYYFRTQINIFMDYKGFLQYCIIINKVEMFILSHLAIHLFFLVIFFFIFSIKSYFILFFILFFTHIYNYFKLVL